MILMVCAALAQHDRLLAVALDIDDLVDLDRTVACRSSHFSVSTALE